MELTSPTTCPCGRLASAFRSTARCIHWPRFGAFLARARADGLDVIHCTTPGPVGLAARYVSGESSRCLWSASTRLSGYWRCSADRAGSARRCASTSAGLRAVAARCWRPHRRRRACSSTPASGPIGARAGARRGYSRPMPRRVPEAQRAAWGARPQVPIVPSAAGCRARRASTCCPEISQSLCPRTAAPAAVHRRRPDAGRTAGGVSRRHLHRPGRAPGRAGAARVCRSASGFPSRTDTFGNAVLEAQARGLPVIVTDEGGPREAVRHGETGLTCGSRGPFTLAVALSWMLREPARRAQMGAPRRHAEARSWPLALELLFQAWREAHRERAAAPPAVGVRAAPAPRMPCRGPARK